MYSAVLRCALATYGLNAFSFAVLAFAADSKIDSLISAEHRARDQKQWVEAEKFGTEAVEKAEDTGVSGTCSNAVKELALTYLQERKYVQAEPLFLRAAALGELAAFSAPVLADDYFGAGVAQNYQNKRSEAEVSLRKALLLLEKNAGTASPSLCPTLRELALALNGLHKRDEAISTFQRCLKIQQGLPGNKQLEAENTALSIANIYSDAGQLKESEDYLRQAVSTRESLNGANDPGLAAMLMNLGDLLRRRGQRNKEAEELLRRALALEDKKSSPNPSEKAFIQNDLALVLENENKLDEAESLLLQAVDMSEKANGENANTSRMLSNLAILYLRQTRLSEAEKLAARALALREQAFSSDHTGIVSEIYGLARVYATEGRFEDATKLYQRAYDIYTKTLGPDAPVSAAAARSLSSSLDAEHRYSAAEELVRASLLAVEKRYGSDNLQTAFALEGVASQLRRQGRLVEAEPLYLRAIGIRESAAGGKASELAAAWNTLGTFLREKGHYSEAFTMIKKAIDAATDDSARGAFISNLALVLLDEENFSLAESTLLRSMDLPDSENLPVHRLRRLGAIACARKQFTEGIPELEQALKHAEKLNLQQLQGTIFEDLGNASRDKGDLDASLGFYQKALDIDKRPQVETLELAMLYDNWGLLDLKQKKLSDAEQHFLTAKRILEKDVGSQSARTALCAAHLAWVYREQNRMFDAESLFRQSLAVEREEVSDDAPILRRCINDYADLLRSEHRDAEAKEMISAANKQHQSRVDTSASPLPDAASVSRETLLAQSGKTPVKAPFGNFSVWIDNSKWKQTKSSKTGELTFSNTDGVSHAELMSQKIPLSTEVLKTATIANFRAVDPDAKVITQQNVKVNGKDLVMMELDFSVNHMPYRFFGYLFGGKSGSIQLMAFTFRDLYQEKLSQLREFANGLQIDDDPMDAMPSNTRKLVSLNDGKESIAYDTTKWSQNPSPGSGQILFSSLAGDGFAVVTIEKIAVPFERLPELAMMNMRKADANVKLLFKEKRLVNGTQVWFLKTEASPQGIPLVYLQYLYSGAEGTIQVATFTGRNLIESKEPDLLSFLEGFQANVK